MRSSILLLFILSIFFSCKKEDENDSNKNVGYIKAKIDGIQYDFNYIYKSPTYGGLYDYSVTYSKENSQVPNNIFVIQFVRSDDLSSVPFTLTKNYNGFGMQVFYKNNTGGNTPSDYSANDFSANNWSQSTNNTGFTATITEKGSNMIKGTFSGKIRDYDNSGNYKQKNITEGSFYIPFE